MASICRHTVGGLTFEDRPKPLVCRDVWRRLRFRYTYRRCRKARPWRVRRHRLIRQTGATDTVLFGASRESTETENRSAPQATCHTVTSEHWRPEIRFGAHAAGVRSAILFSSRGLSRNRGCQAKGYVADPGHQIDLLFTSI